MTDLEYIPIDCKSKFGLRAIPLIFSDENFFNGGMRVRYGVRT